MGIDINAARFLFLAKKSGVDFSRTAMLGRQSLLISADQLATLAGEFGYPLGRERARTIVEESEGYSEPFFRLLGAGEIVSFDVSPYESPTDLHDFNLPIPQQYRTRFTAVFDGGSLEHIFNFPIALQNCMQMVEVGGHFLGVSPANNYFGHGFYQLSPELYYRVFSAGNGFEISPILLHYYGKMVPWLSVADRPDVRDHAYELRRDPTLLLIKARRTAALPLFGRSVQQSWWEQRAWPAGTLRAEPRPKVPLLRRVAHALLPGFCVRLIRQHVLGPRSNTCFQAFDPTSTAANEANPGRYSGIVSEDLRRASK